MKEKLKILLIMLGITFLISIPYLNFENIFTHDISYHVNRIISISEELKLGNFPVLIHSNLLDGFGYANSLFYPELFLYIPAILINLGVEFLTSYKVFTMITTFFTVLLTFYSANRIFKNKNISWTITLLYTGAFYRLTDIYTRGAIGEVLALVFLPLIICGLYEIIFGENKKWWIICFGIFGIINSHVLSFAMTAVLILLVCLINIIDIFKDKSKLKKLVLAGIVSILLTMSFVLPYLEQSFNDKFNVDEKIYNGAFLESYSVSLKELINNKFNVGDYYKGIGTVLLVLSLFILKCKDKSSESKFIKQLFWIGIFALFMTTSLFPWELICNKFNFITTIQFPYRLNIITTVIFSFVGGYAINKILENREELINIVYILVILSTLNLLSSININTENYTKEMIINSAPVGNGEYKPYGLMQDDTKVHDISTQTEYEFTQVGSKIEFQYVNDGEKEIKIHVPLTYYKGYEAYIEKVDGKIIELLVEEDPISKNIIIKSDNIDKIAEGKIVVEYKMTAIQILGYIITLIVLLGTLVYGHFCP